ncbi:hypothetical protein MJO29_012516 [Puccinia striiformis f. sp. tritici]|nr:hypothetical protein MJO29_012516 [Puccinia striiformis f. sp. tritici]
MCIKQCLSLTLQHDTTVDSASDYGNADVEISDCGGDSESEEADTPTSSIPTQHQKSVRLQELCTKAPDTRPAPLREYRRYQPRVPAVFEK